MPKTFSQKIARGFEILGYMIFLLLVGLLFASNFHPLSLTIQALHGALLGGFILHSRGALKTRWFALLWIGNFVFYLIFTLIFALFSFWAIAMSLAYKSSDLWLGIIILLLIGGSLLACLFYSFIGLAAHTEEHGKSRRSNL